MAEFIQETKGQLMRWITHLKREPFAMAFNLLNPVIFLIFLGGSFERVAGNSVGGDYRAYLLAGILGLTVFGNSMAGGIPLLFDKENGFLLRLMSTPINRTSIIVSRFLAVNVATMAQCLLILLLGLVLGVRVASGWPGMLGLLLVSLLLGLGVTVISLMLAFILENHGDFFAIVGVTALPMTFLSSAFVPVQSLPEWMRVLAGINPMTYAIDGMRSLILVGWDHTMLVQMAMALLLFDGIMLWLGARVLRRRVACPSIKGGI